MPKKSKRSSNHLNSRVPGRSLRRKRRRKSFRDASLAPVVVPFSAGVINEKIFTAPPTDKTRDYADLFSNLFLHPGLSTPQRHLERWRRVTLCCCVPFANGVERIHAQPRHRLFDP